ncbi:MAG: hypothetical protein ACE5OZ_12690 [Candidatus Heimdallarchaeota archaeon]
MAQDAGMMGKSLEHFFFLFLGFAFGFLWWNTGSQYRAHLILYEQLEDEQWLSELLLDVMIPGDWQE